MAPTSAKRKKKLEKSAHKNNGSAVSWFATVESNGKEVRQQDFDKWARHLAERRIPQALHRVLPSASGSALLWGLPTSARENSDMLALIRGTSRIKRRVRDSDEEVFHEWVTPWLAESDTRAGDVAYALECVAWSHALPRLATRLDTRCWWDLMDHLLGIIEEITHGDANKNLWVGQLLAGELPLTLAYQFPEIRSCRRLSKPAAAFISKSIVDRLDGQGMLRSDELSLACPLLACWTRCGFLCQTLPSVKLSKPARDELDWLTRQTLRLTRPNLTPAFTNSENVNAGMFSDMIGAAISLNNDQEDEALLRLILHTNDPKGHKQPADDDLPRKPSYQSDWSGIAVLQPEWDPQGPRLTVTYADRQPHGELCVDGQVIFSGPWQPDIRINGRLVEIRSDWETTCWFSDRDVDYLELQAELSDGSHLDRQFLLARDDLFLFTADTIVGNNKAAIEYRGWLPMAEQFRFKPAKESREGFLVGSRRLGLILPLALPEWRVDSRIGTLSAQPEGVVLHQTADARSLHAPLFVDLHRRRMRTAATWRQLTVAEELRIVARDEAVGYRVQVGIEQWLFYRSLLPTISRTVLGQHISHEFLCGRFLRDGSVEPLIEVQGEDTN